MIIKDTLITGALIAQLRIYNKCIITAAHIKTIRKKKKSNRHFIPWLIRTITLLMSFLMYVLVVFVFVLPSSQDHSVRGGRWSERAGHEQVARRLHHGRLPAEEGRAAAHPGGPARGGRLPQRKPFLRCSLFEATICAQS